jgi:hypothetical protein
VKAFDSPQLTPESFQVKMKQFHHNLEVMNFNLQDAGRILILQQNPDETIRG